MRILVSVFAAGLLASACADPSGPAYAETESPVDDNGKADATAELYVRAGETSLWVSRDISRRSTAAGDLLVLHGRASRTIKSGMGFITDDPFGDFEIKSARTFEVTWPLDTARTLGDGVNQFVRLDFAPSPGRPDMLAARIVVRPRLVGFSGSSAVYLTSELTPVIRDGAVVYRATGHTATPLADLRVTIGGIAVAVADVRRPDATHFEVDLAPAAAFAIAGSSAASARIELTATLATGATLVKQSRLGFAVKKLGVTAADAEQEWPNASCTTARKACLGNLPDGAIDLAACGEALEVLACSSQIGTHVDALAVEGALRVATTRLAATAFRSDAAGLVGPARVDALVSGTQQAAHDRLDGLLGRWYLTSTARTTALAGAADRVVLDTYARPLALVAPTTPVPADAAVVRSVAADALLAELATHDFAATALEQSYPELVAGQLAAHVASLRELRETAAIEPYPGMPGVDVLTGRWLGLYFEVTIDHATGTARSVVIEFD